MHMFVSGEESAGGDCWEGAAQQWRSTAQIAPNDPHTPTWTNAEKISDMVTIV